jgi:S1-C subfamily serine protease
VIDLLVLAILAWYAYSGYRQGFAVGLLSLTGFVGGAVLAVRFAPAAVELLPPAAHPVAVLVAVLLLAWFGQLLGQYLGGRLRHEMARSGVARLDQVLGAVAGLVAIAIVLWFVGGAIRQASNPTLARTVAGSRVLGVIDRVMPPWMNTLAGGFRQAVSDSAFPRVFEGVAPERILSVPPPDPTAMPAAVQQAVRRSVVKVIGDAPACGRGQEGSGAVIAPRRVVTNAHVVAAVERPSVMMAGSSRRYPARVVLFDPKTDLAILAVPNLPAPALKLGTTLDRGADAVIAGYPENGPYRAVPARVRTLLHATGEDIYGGSGAIRHVYSLYARVEQGNSGGPLLAVDGSLSGVVFAKSLDDANTGYALTLDEVQDEIRRGATATAAVPTGPCALG